MTPETSRCRAWADRYIELVNARRYPELASLFAPGCTYLHQSAKRVLHDPEEIAAFYTALHDAVKPVARISLWFEEDNRCAFEIESSGVGRPQMRLGGVDIVTLDDEGRATRFAAFPFGSLASWD